jgi:hypothetical protein
MASRQLRLGGPDEAFAVVGVRVDNFGRRRPCPTKPLSWSAFAWTTLGEGGPVRRSLCRGRRSRGQLWAKADLSDEAFAVVGVRVNNFGRRRTCPTRPLLCAKLEARPANALKRLARVLPRVGSSLRLR